MQALALLLPFAGIYAAIRLAPTEKCEFLQYKDYLLPDGSVDEACGVNDGAFVDLDRTPYPVSVTLTPPPFPKAGEAGQYALSLTTISGDVLPPEKLAIHHTRRLHLMLIDTELGDYQHLHPEPIGSTGRYHFTFTPRSSGKYVAFFDFIPLEAARRVLARTSFEVDPSEEPLERVNLPGVVIPEACVPLGEAKEEFTLAGLRLQLEINGPLRPNRETPLSLHILAPHGQASPAALEEVMGAFAHLVAFDPAGKGFAHLHPLDIDPPDGYPAGGTLRFGFIPGEPGLYRLWAQLKSDGQEVFAPFDMVVPDPSRS